MKIYGRNDIYALSLSAQMHGIAAVDAKGNALTPLITYLDVRPSEVIEEIIKNIDPYELYSRTGCPPLTIYPLTKIVWLRVKYKSIFEKAKKFLSAKDYFLYKLLGEPIIDKGVASGSQLLDINSLKWYDEALELCQIDEEALPTLVDCESKIELPKSIARELNLRETVPLVVGSSDGALHSVGVGAVDKRTLALNLGTSGAIRSISSKPLIDRSKDMRFFCYYLGMGYRLPGGAINNAGIVIKWFRDEIYDVETYAMERAGIDSYELMDNLARHISAGANGLIALPFFTGERFPIRDAKARAVLFGLRLSHGKGHILRALMEGCAYTLRWIYEALVENGMNGEVIRIGGGGARSKVWRTIIANVFRLPVEKIHTEEASLLGAAILGFTSIGIYKDLRDACRAMVKVVKREEPDPQLGEDYEKLFKAFVKLYYVLRELF